MSAPLPCPCPRCTRGTASPEERGAHAQVQALLAYVEPERRAFFAAQLDQPRALGAQDDGLTAQVCGVAVADVQRLAHQEAAFGDRSRERLDALAGSARTRELLHTAWDRRLDWREHLVATRSVLELDLRFRGRALSLVCPDRLESFLLLFEIFLAEPYLLDQAVPQIFDLGANIGVAALYFHVLFPRAELVCVEPLPANVEILEENLRRNGVRGRVLPVAVGPTSGSVALHACPLMPSLSSVLAVPQVGLASEVLHVPARAFPEVVQGHAYGLKLDVEGAEHALVQFPEVLAHARWAVGELHLGPEILPVERAGDLVRLLEQHFQVQLDGPGVFGNSVTYTFRGTR